MRVLGVAIALMLGCAAGTAWAADFPYVAYVNSADVYIRSGPGRDYYPTDKLNKGEKVEIFRHDPGGWYAIRPPRNSFSWVSVRNLDPIDDTLAVINSKRAVARVGSTLADVRDVIQVRLDVGEKVELLEPPSGSSPWQKIAPPAGEFRWIFSKFVDSDVPADVAEDERAAGGQARREDSAASDRKPAVRAAGHDEAASSEDAPAARAVSASPRPSNLLSEAGRKRELERIELDLSLMVSDDIANWSLGPLQRRGEDVLGEAASSTERGRARVVLNQIARFDDIKTRHDAIRRLQADAAPAGGASRSAGRRNDPRFDGVGKLAPVVSTKAGGPQYALVDAQNAVVSFVTPAPGVNLKPYVDKYIGVNGQCGYLTDLQRQHINVQRVSELDVTRR